MMLTFFDAKSKLEELKQSHLLSHFPLLNEKEKENILNDIEKLDVSLFKQLRNFSTNHKRSHYEPISTYFEPNSSFESVGKEKIREGKCALLVLAGGSGSRLQFEGPKGCFPISKVRKCSLFQLIAEKVKAASDYYHVPLEMAIMVSPSNEEETKGFFEKHDFFGLKRAQVHFFCQDVWPLLDLEGNLFLEEKGKIAFGPNGNGGAFKSLAASPIYERWKKQNIEMINVIPVDNPLADPFDAALFGGHFQQNNEITIKAVFRKSPSESVGVFVKGPQVVEYSEERIALEKPVLANIGLFCFSLSFIEKIKDISMPLHKAKKRVKRLDITSQTPNAWKYELFIFDVFSCSRKAEIFCYPREICFAPLKNFSGEDSIVNVQEALQEADRQAFYRVSNIMPAKELDFELAQDFYYPTDDLIAKWRGKPLLKRGYIS